jgi:hypothetical protein
MLLFDTLFGGFGLLSDLYDFMSGIFTQYLGIKNELRITDNFFPTVPRKLDEFYLQLLRLSKNQ